MHLDTKEDERVHPICHNTLLCAILPRASPKYGLHHRPVRLSKSTDRPARYLRANSHAIEVRTLHSGCGLAYLTGANRLRSCTSVTRAQFTAEIVQYVAWAGMYQ